MALHITRDALEQILTQARRDHPIETCGVVASPEGSLVASRTIPMRNIAASEVFYQFDSREQFQLFSELDDRNETCKVIYHSHTSSEAFPSREDIEYAGSPDAHYLIVSTWKLAAEVARSFRIVQGRVYEERIVVSSHA
ncbi:M67 family metallopeptidase [Pseudomonas aeruginosa]|uniref:Mov34/MPN/PAD-1 family protein n=1 Tax=Pseudomonas TaxID=286 RepID=UPI000F7E8615|nr:M67 family metallopeptidase [Pseudomonas aeruginosa]HEK0639924.1 M67 family metallopeptidase [Proteus mirabilis]MCO2889562.1 M67 family metallopeptidase [Pseudomonas aeruginosa]RTB44065.1 M67 family peptidase [Pseudomonas aeruginosa]RTB49000.1 M67 family peptidase [Pseudomonas aeruginosa]RTB87319.1 M67 family peptidase [Pseudomonas aeruginosa]